MSRPPWRSVCNICSSCTRCRDRNLYTLPKTNSLLHIHEGQTSPQRFDKGPKENHSCASQSLRNRIENTVERKMSHSYELVKSSSSALPAEDRLCHEWISQCLARMRLPKRWVMVRDLSGNATYQELRVISQYFGELFSMCWGRCPKLPIRRTMTYTTYR
jgi:hypothetical protein